MRNSPPFDKQFAAVILTITLCLASCSRTPTPEPEASVTFPVAAASPVLTNSKNLVSKDPKEQYFTIKQAFEEILPSTPHQVEENLVDLFSCTSGTDYLGVPLEDPITPLANLAYEVVQFTKYLKAIGYPKSQWDPLLTEFEREQLPLRISEMGKSYEDQSPSETKAIPFRERIIRELNAYREKSNPDLPRVMYEGNCGAGEIGIHIALNPTDGRAFFIPVFFFELCKAQSLDPHNHDQCNRWREPASGLLLNVSGDYVYRAKWSDGTTKDGRLNFTNVEEGQTVTLSKN